MKTGIGGSIVVILLLLVGLGVALGVLVSNNALFQPEPTALEAHMAAETWRVEQQRLHDQQLYERARQAQALEQHQMYRKAVAWVIQTGGLVASVALAIIAMLYGAAGAYRLAWGAPRREHRVRPPNDPSAGGGPKPPASTRGS